MPATVPEVSICIAARNERDCLPDTISSVREQTWPAITEILICVNGSTDGTLELARTLAAGDPRVRVLTSEPGKSRAWNTLVGAATNDVLAFVDADVLLHPEAVEQAVRTLTASPSLVAVGSWLGRCRPDRARPSGLQMTVVRHTILVGRFYVARRSSLLAAMQVRTGSSSIPGHIVNEDEWVRRSLLDPATGSRCYAVLPRPLVLFQAEQTWRDRTKFLIRVRAGRRQIDAYLGPPPKEPARHRLRRQAGVPRRAIGLLPWVLERARLAATLVFADLWVRLTLPDPRLLRRSVASLWRETRSTKRRFPARALEALSDTAVSALALDGRVSSIARGAPGDSAAAGPRDAAASGSRRSGASL